MSYTEFEYSGLSITPVEDVDQDQDGQLEANWLAGKPGPQGVGSSTALWLHRAAYTVSFTVQNTGQVAGTEVCIRSPRPESSELIARAKTNRYLRFTYIFLLARVSRRLSCADSRTWSCSLVKSRASMLRCQDMTYRFGTSRVSRGCVPWERTLFLLVRAVGILGWRARCPSELYHVSLFCSVLLDFRGKNPSGPSLLCTYCTVLFQRAPIQSDITSVLF
jgi:hypothetical protein